MEQILLGNKILYILLYLQTAFIILEINLNYFTLPFHRQDYIITLLTQPINLIPRQTYPNDALRCSWSQPLLYGNHRNEAAARWQH